MNRDMHVYSNNTSRFIILICSILILIANGYSYAEFDIKRWEFYKQINASARAGSKYARVTIDKDIYCNSQAFPSDLRIITNQNREVPYVLMTASGETHDTAFYTPRILNKSVVSGKYGLFVLDMGKSGLINNKMIINTTSRNFMYRVEVEGSQNGKQWAVLMNNAYIFNFSRDYYSEKTYISYPENTYRYLRVRIWNYNEPPINIISVSMNYQKTQPAIEELIYQGKGTITQNSKEKTTDIVVDLGCKGMPSERVRIESSDTNYYRGVTISVSDDLMHWEPLMNEGYILKYDTPTFKGEDSSVPYNTNLLSRYLKFSIVNYDNPPIAISRVSVYAYQRKLFFITDRSSRYQLFYGNKGANSPVYDAQQIMRYVPSRDVVTLKLGPQVKNPQFSLPIFSGLWMERNPWVLWSILIISIILLTIFSVRLIRQTVNPHDSSPH